MSEKIPSFRSKVSKSGDSKVITIPAYFIREGFVDPTKKYEIQLEICETEKS